MKVLYLSYDGMTDPLGQSQVIPYLCGLSKLGHKIHLVSFEKKVNYKHSRSIVEAILAQDGITWHPRFYTKKPPVLSTVIDMGTLYRTCLVLHKVHKFDLFHCRSYITALVALSFKKRHGVPFVFDMRGFWADERVEGRIWNLDNPIFKIIYKYFKQKELDFLKVSAHVISLTHAAKAELLSWNVITADKIQVIPCCADLVHFNIPSIDKRREVRKLLGLVESDLVFSYIGSLGTWYMVDEMLDLFQRIKTTYPQSKLLLITTHTQQEIKQYLSQTQIHPNDVILKSGTRVEMPLLIAASDISMFFVRPTFSKKASSPTKMAEIMGCGLPIICNTDIGDVEEIVTDTQCGYCTADFSKTSKDEIIRNIPNLLALDPIKIREGALKYFSLDEGIQKYNNVYLSVASCVKEK